GSAGHGQQLYDLLTREAPRGNRLLAVGGVHYDATPGPPGPRETSTRGPALKPGRPPRWTFLPRSREEVRRIAALLDRPGPPEVLEGARAAEAAVRDRLAGARYVHLATHGFFADPTFRSALGRDPVPERLKLGGVELKGPGSTVVERNPLLLSGVVLAGA